MKRFPENIDQKLGFDVILERTAARASTPMGARAVQEMKPVSTSALVNDRLNGTREMLAIFSSGERFPMDQVDDTSKYLDIAKAEGSILSAHQIIAITQLAGCARKIKQYLRSREEDFASLARYGQRIQPLKDFEKTVSQVIDDHGEVRDNASPELQKIRRELISRRADVRKTLQQLMRTYSKDDMVADGDITMRGGRMVVPLRSEFKRKVNGFVHDVSATGQTVYLEPAEALSINNEIRELEAGEQREIERLMQMLTAEVRTNREALITHHQVISDLDMILAVARMSYDFNGVVPELSQDRQVFLNEVYNPVLWLRFENKKDVVPLTLELSQDETGVMITGPNAGGKSVTLKTIGLCQMMMQCGFALPALEGTKLPISSSLFVDLGDEQSIDNDLSTFSSRLEWIKTTLDRVQPDSLVLIDEAGTGTDPAEGTALFQAFFEELHKRNIRVIATTHHGDLKEFAHRQEGWINASMIFDQDNLSPTYYFQKGVPGSSYAFEIASRLGVSDSLISKARNLVGSSKNRMEDLIVELEKQRQELLDDKANINRKQKELDDLREKYDRKYGKIKEETDAIRKQALDEASAILSDANKRVEEAVRQVSEQNAEREAVKQARQDLDSYRREISGKQKKVRKKPKKKSGKPPQVGDTVQMVDGQSQGMLRELNGNKAVIEVNGMRLKTRLDQLVKVEEPAKKKEPQEAGWKSDSTVRKRASHRIDLRGRRADEADQLITQFIDEASSAGLHQLEIVHGKGNGVLKNVVHEHLGRRKEIKSFDVAPEEQGGHGCTVAELG